MKISVVIPIYNCDKSIVKLIQRLESEISNNYQYEIILVNDFSNNDTRNILELLNSEKPNVRVLNLGNKIGQHHATMRGIDMAQGEYIITMDQDFSHRPEDIMKLIENADNSDCDVIYGKYLFRELKKFREKTFRIMRTLIIIFIPNMNNGISSYRLLKKSAIIPLKNFETKYFFIDGILARQKVKSDFILLQGCNPKYMKSTYSTIALFKHTFNAFFYYGFFRRYK